MTGIYRIYNLLTNMSYIGQSKDIAQRIEEHFYHRNSSNGSYIDRAIGEIGIANFMFQILEICNENELDQKEEYYINLFGSNINGYNIVSGGQHNIGESNANSKLTSNDVYYIRECYKNHIEFNIVYEFFKNRITRSTFFAAWEGSTWNNIHMDVYTEENKEYYKTLINNKSYLSHTNFSDEDIIRFRTRYITESAESVYVNEKLELVCKFNTFRGILCGDTYKHLPVYSKHKKCWIYLNNNEVCNDYSLEEK